MSWITTIEMDRFMDEYLHAMSRNQKWYGPDR